VPRRCHLAAALVFAAAGTGAAQEHRPASWRGANYLVPTALGRTSITGFLPVQSAAGLPGEFSPIQVAQEIEHLASQGIDNVRVLGSFYAYVADKAGFLSALGELAAACEGNGISITYQVWNAIAFPWDLPLWTLLGGSRASDPTNPLLYAAVRQIEAQAQAAFGDLRPRPRNAPPEPYAFTLFAEPGSALLLDHGGDPAGWPHDLRARVDEYLDQLALLFTGRGRGAFASYDLFNEPDAMGQEPPARDAYVDLIRYSHARLRRLHPAAAFTVGWATWTDFVDRMDALLDGLGVRQTYVSYHHYDRPEPFAAALQARSAYARGAGKDLVVSEFHRADTTAGALDGQLRALAAAGAGGQVWGALQSNIWERWAPNAYYPADGVWIPSYPVTFVDRLGFTKQNARDVDALAAWGTIAHDPASVAVIDAAGAAVGTVRAGDSYRLEARAANPFLGAAPVVFLFGVEAALPGNGPLGSSRFGLGHSVYDTGVIAADGVIRQGIRRSSFIVALPPAVRGHWLVVSALVGTYPPAAPWENAADLAAYRALPIE
jgi:hypothetical protein